MSKFVLYAILISTVSQAVWRQLFFSWSGGVWVLRISLTRGFIETLGERKLGRRLPAPRKLLAWLPERWGLIKSRTCKINSRNMWLFKFFNFLLLDFVCSGMDSSRCRAFECGKLRQSGGGLSMEWHFSTCTIDLGCEKPVSPVSLKIQMRSMAQTNSLLLYKTEFR